MQSMDELYSTFTLALEPGKDYESLLYFVERGSRIRFNFDSWWFGQEVSVYTTYEPDAKDYPVATDSAIWYKLNVYLGSTNKNDDFGRYAELRCLRPGPFKFCVLRGANGINNPDVTGYFHVLPKIAAELRNSDLPLEAIACQSIYASLLGPFAGWKSQLSVTMNSGYNMIHLSPVQKLGKSGNAWSISDQLELNEQIFGPSSNEGFGVLEKFIKGIEKEWNMLTVSDLVLGHTATDSHWLAECPDCFYNLENTPHLRPAYLLDRVLYHFSNAVASGAYAKKGLSSESWTPRAISCMKAILLDEVYPKTKIHELFQVNAEQLVRIFKEKIAAVGQPSPSSAEPRESLDIIQDMEYKRLSCTVDMDLAMSLFNKEQDKNFTEAERQQVCAQEFQQYLWHLNNEAARKCWDNLRYGVENLVNHVRKQQEKAKGEKRLQYTDKSPLFPQYFTQQEMSTKWEQDEEIMHSPEKRKYIMVKNGWVPNEGFPQTTVEPKSRAYFRREVLCWNDSVKLRYGNCPDDCKYLWERMAKYTCTVAKIFHGISIVDLLGSPIHVCEYMLKLVRKTRPNAFVCAKVDPDTKNITRVINRLGLAAIIHTTANVQRPHEFASLLRSYGGKPIGAFLRAPLPPLLPSNIPIMVFDMTLGDENPIKRRTPIDVLPTATLLAAARLPYGSSRGIDELVPQEIDATEKHKVYCTWNEEANVVQTNWTEENQTSAYVNTKSGVIRARQAVNRLHTFLSQGEFTEMQVAQQCENMIVVERRSPPLAQSVIIAARNCFWINDNERREFVAPIVIIGNLEEILYEGTVQERRTPKELKTAAKPVNGKNKSSAPEGSVYLKGLRKYELLLKEMASLFDSDTIEIITRTQSNVKEIDFIRFKAGAVIAMLISMPKENRIAMSTLRKELARIDVVTLPPESLQQIADFRSTEATAGPDLKALVRNLSLPDYNQILFRCENEQLRDEYSVGAYGIAGIGKLAYCGLQSIVYHLNKIRLSGDMSHPLCQHLRQGDWLPDYISKRLLATEGTMQVGEWFKYMFEIYKDLPAFCKPCYFDAIVTGAHRLMIKAVLSKMPSFVQNGGPLVRTFAISSLIFCGPVTSGKLPEVSSYLQLPKQETNAASLDPNQMTTIAAGIPYYSAASLRNWSRDTFIALRGLLLIPGRYMEARCIILAYSGLTKNGLLPTRICEHTNVRFGSRDSVWWWLLAIKHYTEMVPNGQEIMWDPVIRYCPKESRHKRSYPTDQHLFITIQEAINTIFQGRKHTRLNEKGLAVEIGVDKETGFVFGGNQYNAGTWMDKIGSSDLCNNYGKPATPRDGSAVEIVAISYAVIRWLNKLANEGQYPYAGVKCKNANREIFWTWETWANKIMAAFEKKFWIPPTTCSGGRKTSASKPLHPANTGFYRDTVNSEIRWSETQLRPNYLIAIAVAPELFNISNATVAVEKAEEKLLGRLGMKTLNEEDWAYNGYYSAMTDSTDGKTAKGFNLHQGPEWVWLIGYFLRAKMQIAMASPNLEARQAVISRVKQILGNHWEHIKNDPWFSLPAFTNKDGAHCQDACPAQATSIGCILEVLYDLTHVMKDE